jgi:hypothetical protein
MAVRMAEPFIHPRTFSSTGGLPGDMLIAFLVCLAGMGMLWLTLVRFELSAKGASADLNRLRRALDPAQAPAPAGRTVAPTAVTVSQASLQSDTPEKSPGGRT